MLPFGVTIPATVPQGSEIPEGLMNNPVDDISRDLFSFEFLDWIDGKEESQLDAIVTVN